MLLLVIGLFLMLGVHSISIVSPRVRAAAVASIGEPLWKIGYMAVALLGLALIVYGYGLTREAPILLWNPPVALRHIALTAMLLVFPLFLASFLPGHIQAATKHPMVASVKVWAFAHLLANGTLADLLLFASFLIWAIVARISLKRRGKAPRPASGGWRNDVIAVVAGVALYLVTLFWLHEWLFGVALLM